RLAEVADPRLRRQAHPDRTAVDAPALEARGARPRLEPRGEAAVRAVLAGARSVLREGTRLHERSSLGHGLERARTPVELLDHVRRSPDRERVEAGGA